MLNRPQYAAGTLGNLAFGGAQSQNLGGGLGGVNTSARRGDRGPGGMPGDGRVRPGIDYDPSGYPEPTWGGIFNDWFWDWNRPRQKR